MINVIEDLERRLQLAREEKEVAQKLSRKVAVTEENLTQARKQNRELALILSDEKKDVDQLEQLSVANLFATILGTKDEKLKKERQEYLAVKLKYDASEKLIGDLEKELILLKEQLNLLKTAEEKYQQLLNEKEEVLKRQEGATARELLFLAEEEGRLSARGKELREAEKAAQNVLNSLDELNSTLSSAANWGAWDMLGGGLIATAVKHSHIDEAREKIVNVQSNLNWLRRELADVEIYAELGIEIGGLASFADYFFDGLIADWVVQSRINEAEKRAKDLQGQIGIISQNLRNQLEETAEKSGELRKRKQALVEQSVI